MRRELEAGSAEGREGDGEPEGSRAGARRVGSVGAEEEEALLPLGRRRGDGVGGSSHGVGSPPDYLELTNKLYCTGCFIWSETWVGLTKILGVPLSAQFCLGCWQLGGSSWAIRQHGGTSKSESTQPRSQTR